MAAAEKRHNRRKRHRQAVDIKKINSKKKWKINLIIFREIDIILFVNHGCTRVR
jgi:hypothetical protein